jgi:hypothetical protein
MKDPEWIYMGHVRRGDVTNEWIYKTNALLQQAFAKAVKRVSQVPCSCSKCANRKRQSKRAMGEHIWKNGYTTDYTRWIFHGEAHCTREEVVLQYVKDFDANGGSKHVK